MDYEDTPEEARFRDEVRAWLQTQPAPGGQPTALNPFEGFDDRAEMVAEARAWQARLASAGLGAVSWPIAYGGRGVSVAESIVFAEEIARAGVPTRVFSIGIGMIGPTLIAHGDDDQRNRYLGPMLRGEEIWCQLWSEPGAGSDLAGVRTRAELHGDEFVINGQKVWTSGAHYSDFGLGLFRTDPSLPKHRGMSTIIVPMSAPGVSIRPLRQLNGGAHFNEVFLDDVRVPASGLVGTLNDGWAVAQTTMMHERLSAGAIMSMRQVAEVLLDLYATAAAGATGDHLHPTLRQRVVRAYALARLFDLTTSRVRSAIARAGLPGPEVSVLKLFASDVGTEIAETAVAVLGVKGTLVGEGAPDGGRWAQNLLASFAMHIGGGTDEIQRNIIAETVLAMPREPRTDRDRPFASAVVVGASGTVSQED